MKKNFSYVEPKNSLDNRIRAHLSFSNFSLHEWIEKNLNISSGDKILDMGCGNGNFLDLFLKMTNKKCEIYAVDKNEDLILEAKSQYRNENIIFEVNDFDKVNIENKQFDWIFFIYSIYYSQKPQELISKMHSYLNGGGHLVIIGPGKSNAIELDNLNHKITGLDPKPEYRERQKRIEDEFYKLSKEIFGKSNCELNILNNRLTFPNEIDYANYYWSTLLWRDSLERLESFDEKKLKEKSLIEIKNLNNFIINKQVSTLIVKK